MQIRCDVMAHEGKEACNSKGLVAVSKDIEIDRVDVEYVGEEGDNGVDRYHEQNPYYARPMVSCMYALSNLCSLTVSVPRALSNE